MATITTATKVASEMRHIQVTGLAGASAAAESRFVVRLAGYPVLTLLAAVAVVPLVALALRPPPVPAATDGT